MEFVFFWLVLSVVVGVIASARGRSGFGFFLLSIILSPLIGLILAVALPRITPADPDAPTPDSHVRCPDCRELIRRDAVVCKHCRCSLVPQPLPKTPAQELGEAAGRALGMEPISGIEWWIAGAILIVLGLIFLR